MKEERKFAAGKAFAKTANSAERRRSEEAKPKPERAERSGIIENQRPVSFGRGEAAARQACGMPGIAGMRMKVGQYKVPVHKWITYTTSAQDSNCEGDTYKTSKGAQLYEGKAEKCMKHGAWRRRC